MKFDCAIMNPPYNGNLDLEFIQLAKKNSNLVVVVHPAISMITRKNTKRFVDFKLENEGHVSYIKMFNGNPIFNIGLFHPCQIMVIDNTKKFDSIEVEYSFDNKETTKHSFKSVFDITKWGNVPEYYSLEKKILDYCKNIGNCHDFRGNKDAGSGKNYSTGNWYVNVANVRGHVASDCMFNKDFYTTVTKDLVPEKAHTKCVCFSFASKHEAQMFLDYLKSDFARFSLSIFKSSGSLNRGELAAIPYLPDYKTEWTKERITELFKITPEEWAFIEKVIPKYY